MWERGRDVGTYIAIVWEGDRGGEWDGRESRRDIGWGM